MVLEISVSKDDGSPRLRVYMDGVKDSENEDVDGGGIVDGGFTPNRHHQLQR